MQGDKLFVQSELDLIATVLNETTVDLFSLGRAPDVKEDIVSAEFATPCAPPVLQRPEGDVGR